MVFKRRFKKRYSRHSKFRRMRKRPHMRSRFRRRRGGSGLRPGKTINGSLRASSSSTKFRPRFSSGVSAGSSKLRRVIQSLATPTFVLTGRGSGHNYVSSAVGKDVLFVAGSSLTGGWTTTSNGMSVWDVFQTAQSSETDVNCFRRFLKQSHHVAMKSSTNGTQFLTIYDIVARRDKAEADLYADPLQNWVASNNSFNGTSATYSAGSDTTTKPQVTLSCDTTFAQQGNAFFNDFKILRTRRVVLGPGQRHDHYFSRVLNRRYLKQRFQTDSGDTTEFLNNTVGLTYYCLIRASPDVAFEANTDYANAGPLGVGVSWAWNGVLDCQVSYAPVNKYVRTNAVDPYPASLTTPHIVTSGYNTEQTLITPS